MFGESLSESPRVPSPWDFLISTPPSPAIKPPASREVPKLVPEAEEGNVEYKLQLLSPSPCRFARLVTQLKWRLLEGGGQAYYELGVADSGALVGLPRADLEQSLETLEMMAGEIGASVIVVKEIEVPAAMAGLAGSETDHWNGKRRKKRLALLHASTENDSTTSTTDPDTSTTDTTDFDDDPSTEVYGGTPLHLHTDPTSLLEDSFTLFSMNSESDIDEAVSVRSTVSVDLEIASVFKPRPTRRRVYHTHAGNTLTVASAPQLKSGKHSSGTQPKKHHRHHTPHSTNVAPLDEGKHCKQNLNTAGKRRQARNLRRDEKRRTFLSHPKEDVHDIDVPAQEIHIPPDVDTELTLLHASLAPSSFSDEPTVPTDIIPDIHPERGPDPEEDDDDDDIFVGRSASTPDNTASVVSSNNNARLIVEALVVRKLSLEEAFLDFGGFSLM